MMFSRLLLATAVALQCVGLANGGADSTAPGGEAEAWNPRELQLSSYQCTEREWFERTCVFENLVMYNGQLYFIAEEGQRPELPTARLNEYDKGPEEEGAVGVKSLLKVVTREGVERLTAAPQGARVKVLRLDNGLVMHPQHLRNWWHVLDDVGNIYLRFCTHLGICSYSAAKRSRSALFFYDSPHLNVQLPTVSEIFQCFGKELSIKHDGKWMQGEAEAWKDRAYLVGRTLLGAGDLVVHPYLFTDDVSNSNHNVRASEELRLGRIHFLRECAGLDAVPALRSRPNVLLLNRPYSAGRSIIGLDDVYVRLREVLPLGAAASVRLLYLDRMSFRQQAEAFSETDVLVISHGAAASNIYFLPPTGVVVEVSSWLGHRNHDEKIVSGLPSKYFNMSFLPYVCEGHLEPNVGKLRRHAKFMNLSADAKTWLLLLANDPAANNIDWLVGTVFPGGQHELLFYQNYLPQVEKLLNTTLAAVERWYEMAPLAPRLLEAARAAAPTQRRHSRRGGGSPGAPARGP